MKSLQPAVIELTGSTMLPCDPGTVLSNLVNATLHATHQPTMSRIATHVDCARWRHTALTASTMNTVEELRRHFALAQEDPRLLKNSTIELIKRWGSQIAILASRPVHHRDASAHLWDELVRGGNWGVTYVAHPVCGFERPYLSLTAPWQPMGVNIDAYLKDDAFANAIGELVMLMDRPAFNQSLIPEASDATGRDARDPFFGSYTATLYQEKHMAGFGLLYACQAMGFQLRLRTAALEQAAGMAAALYPAEKAIIDWYLDVHKEAAQAIPLHPVLQTVATALQRFTVATRYGIHSGVYYLTNSIDEVVKPTLSSINHELAPDLSSVARELHIAAIASFLRMRELVKASVAWPTAWMEKVKERISPRILQHVGDGLTQITAADVLIWLQARQEYVETWPKLVSQLAWPSPITVPDAQLNACGGDFILTDGDKMMGAPLDGLLGLRPVVTMANKRVMALGVEFQRNFGAGPSANDVLKSLQEGGYDGELAFEYSIVPVPAKIAAFTADTVLSYYYLPLGALMGEDGYDSRYVPPDSQDEAALAVVEFYRSRSTAGYINAMYNTPRTKASKSDGETIVINTSWDAIAWSPTPGRAQSAMLSFYGNEETSIDVRLFAVKADGAGWPARVPVKMARGRYVMWLNELGVHCDNLQFTGVVLYDHEVTFDSSIDALAAIHNLMVVRVPTLPDVVPDAKPIEPATKPA